MSLPFGQVAHAPAQDGTGEPDVKGRCYSIRVVRFTAGATIAFNDVNNKLTVLASSTYPFPPGGWERIYLTGSITIEYSLRPDFRFDMSGGSPDAAGNQPVVGAAADGVAPVGASVLMAGKGLADGFVHTLATNNIGITEVILVDGGGTAAVGADAAAVARSIQTAGKDGGGLHRALAVDTTGRLVPGADALDLSFNVPAQGAQTVLGPTFTPRGVYRRAEFMLALQGLITGGGVLDVYIQTTLDGGATWIDVAHLPQIAAAAAVARFAVVLEADSAVPAAPLAGLNTVDGTPTLAVNTIRNLVGNAYRIAYVQGICTTITPQTVKGLFN